MQVQSRSTEAQLLSHCLKGDADAWDELFNLHYEPAARFVFQLGYDLTREDVEEICQEVFLTVIKSLNTFQGNCQFQTWLFRIAANRARDYRQKLSAAKRGGGIAPLSLHAKDFEDSPAIDPPSPLPGPDLTLLKKEQIALVGRALDQLGEPCQEVIELRYFADLSYEEIAAALELNAKTVSSRLSKCLGRLQVLATKIFSAETREKTSASSV
jgi:RNA polymerase sigma-70 factor (ECF subfamily)